MVIYYFKSLFFSLIFITFKITKEICVFNVSKLDLYMGICYSSLGKFDFSIEGKFNSTPEFLDNAYFELETSNGTKIKTECSPFEITNSFQCSINLIKYPLNNVDLILPTKAPYTKAYSFVNWEETIGASPGKSNVFSKVKCLPEESNVFIPTSIEINGCFGKKNNFTIVGEWENKKEKPFLNDFLLPKIKLDNANKDEAECEVYDKENFVLFKCLFKGEGEIRIKEQYFEGFLEVFKIKAIDSNQTVSKCGNYSSTNFSNFIFLNKILMITILLLL